jgi:uncharacterized protein
MNYPAAADDEAAADPPPAAAPADDAAADPTTNTAFTRTLGNVVSRPMLFSIPQIIIKLPLGDKLVNAAILSSTHVLPQRLIKMGYKFRFPYLESVLRRTPLN